jgi:hypothetical protein
MQQKMRRIRLRRDYPTPQEAVSSIDSHRANVVRP